MASRALGWIKQHWIVVLVLITSVCFFINTAIFYPGYMSGDTMYHLGQAISGGPVNDIQPLTQSLVWKFLIFITGKISSMLIFQLILLWTGLFLLSWYVVRKTNNLKLSLLPLLFGFLPIVINISGVIWSDNQMTFSLLLACSLLLILRIRKNRYIRWTCFTAVFSLILFASLVRYNAILATFPIFYLAIYQTKVLSFPRRLLATVTFIIMIMLLFPLMRTIVGAKHIETETGPMTDDIVHILSREEIAQAAISDALKNSLVNIKKCVDEKKIVIDVLPCSSQQDKTNFLINYSEDVKKTWKLTVKEKPIKYLERRVTVFVYVLFPHEGRAYIWHEGVDNNNYGQSLEFVSLAEINRMYVFNFGYKHFSFLYEPWFWLFANFGLLIYIRKERFIKDRVMVSCLAGSGILYILGFIPTGVAADYRYIYWPVFTGLISITLVLTEMNSLTPENRKYSNLTRKPKPTYHKKMT